MMASEIPDRDIAIDKRRHLPEGVKAENPLLVVLTRIERDEDFLEIDVVRA